MISGAQFNLQGTVMNGMVFFQCPYTLINESVARVAFGHDQVDS
jgi:hypothetical protein